MLPSGDAQTPQFQGLQSSPWTIPHWMKGRLPKGVWGCLPPPPPFPSWCRREVPGLKRTIARRQPNSVLSICMSRIFETSSVSTLQGPSHKERGSGVTLALALPQWHFPAPFVQSLGPPRAVRGPLPLHKGQGWIPGTRGKRARPPPPAAAPHLSKMAPTPALWALFLWTWRPVARRIPSLTAMDRWEKEAISNSFQPGGKQRWEGGEVSESPAGRGGGGEVITPQSFFSGGN